MKRRRLAETDAVAAAAAGKTIFYCRLVVLFDDGLVL
jgi:hypothetical protein